MCFSQMSLKIEPRKVDSMKLTPLYSYYVYYVYMVIGLSVAIHVYVRMCCSWQVLQTVQQNIKLESIWSFLIVLQVFAM